MEDDSDDETEGYVYKFSIFLIGSSRVGKTKIVSNFLKSETTSEYENSSVWNVKEKKIKYNGKIINLEITDTPSQKNEQNINVMEVLSFMIYQKKIHSLRLKNCWEN